MKASLMTLILLVVGSAQASESMIAQILGNKPRKLASFSQYTKVAATALAIGKDSFFAAGDGLNVIKYNSKGRKLWHFKFGRAGQAVNAIATDEDGNLFVATSEKSPRIIKLDSNGKKLWQRSFTQLRTCIYVSPDQGGACFISGYDSSGACYVARLDSTGQIKWGRKVQEPSPQAGDYENDDGYTYGYLGLQGQKLLLVFPFQKKDGILELNPTDGSVQRQYYGKWHLSCDPFTAVDSQGRRFQIWNTGRFAVG